MDHCGEISQTDHCEHYGDCNHYRSSARGCYELSGAVACQHAEPKALPHRCFRRGVVLRRSLPGPSARRCASTYPRVARGVRRLEVDRTRGLLLAKATPRLSALGSGLPADEEVADRRCLRGDGPRLAYAFAPGPR